MNYLKMAVILLTSAAIACAAPYSGAAEITKAEWQRLSDKDISPQGRLALSLDEKEWRHAETEHFIYHFTNDKEAETVYTHAEVYYGWIKELFGVAEDRWAKKSHIFIFTDKTEWDSFKAKAELGIEIEAEAFTTGWELFIYRDPYWLSPIKSLAHEITHIIAFRFLGGPIPLFLDEGLAEYIGYKAAALKVDGDEYRIRTVKLIPEKEFIPVEKLIETRSYTDADTKIFYRESELVARYLITNYDGSKFYTLLRAVSRGEPFKKSLEEVYGMEFETFRDKFTDYATLEKKTNR